MTNMKTFTLSFLLLISFTVFAQNNKSFTVHFDFNKHSLTKAATASLDSFISAAKATGNILSIQLNGHCDAMGNDAYNDRLSRQRVATVKNYLLKNNIEDNKITKRLLLLHGAGCLSG